MNLRHSLLLVLSAIAFTPALFGYFPPTAWAPAAPQFDNFRQSLQPEPAQIQPAAQGSASVAAGNGSIRGYVFQDVWLNGLWAKGIPGVPATLNLEDSALTLRRTVASRASDGYYQFTAFARGTTPYRFPNSISSLAALAAWPFTRRMLPQTAPSR